MLAKDKYICLKLNCKQTVTLRSGFLEFQNYFRQVPALSKIDANFECILQSVKISEDFYIEKYQDHIPCSCSYKRVCVDNKFSKPLPVYSGESSGYKFFEAILENYEYYKKVIKKHNSKKIEYDWKRTRFWFK